MNSESHKHSHFVAPTKYYLGTFAALVFLTIITVAAARIEFGVLNVTIAMGIAVIKASIVVLFFMGLRWDKGFNVVILVSCIVFLVIFITFTLSDTTTRGAVEKFKADRLDIKSPVKIIEAGEHHGEKGAHGTSAEHDEKKPSSQHQEQKQEH